MLYNLVRQYRQPQSEQAQAWYCPCLSDVATPEARHAHKQAAVLMCHLCADERHGNLQRAFVQHPGRQAPELAPGLWPAQPVQD